MRLHHGIRWGMIKAFIIVTMLYTPAHASPDKHYYRILVQAIDEAHSKGPTTPAKVLSIWRTEMTKLGDGACHCAQLVGFADVNGKLVEKRTLCNQALLEDLTMALMPELLRLPGNYDRWKEALKKTDAEADAIGEEIATSFIAANVSAKEQAEVRRRTGRCITGGEDD